MVDDYVPVWLPVTEHFVDDQACLKGRYGKNLRPRAFGVECFSVIDQEISWMVVGDVHVRLLADLVHGGVPLHSYGLVQIGGVVPISHNVVGIRVVPSSVLPVFRWAKDDVGELLAQEDPVVVGPTAGNVAKSELHGPEPVDEQRQQLQDMCGLAGPVRQVPRGDVVDLGGEVERENRQGNAPAEGVAMVSSRP